MASKEKGLARWEKIKSKGLACYIIRMGIFYYGLSFFLIWVFLVPFIDNSFKLDFINSETFISRLIIFGVFSPLFGMLMAYAGWKGLVRKYEQCDFVK